MREPVRDEEMGIIVEELEASAEGLDPLLVARLDRARRAAVERGLTGRRRFFPVPQRWLLVGAGTAMAMMLALSFRQNPPQSPMAARDVEEVEILTAQEQMDIVKDQEFYRWLEEREAAGSRVEG